MRRLIEAHTGSYHGGFAHWSRRESCPALALLRMTDRTTASLSGLGSTLAALVLGVAMGAAWLVLTLYARHRMSWPALPVGALIGVFFGRRAFLQPSWAGSALAATVATLIAAAMVQVLVVAALLAGSMGLGIGESITTAGVAMLAQLGWSGLGAADLALIGGGVLLAVLITAWFARRPAA